jgi:hypothetical protein
MIGFLDSPGRFDVFERAKEEVVDDRSEEGDA